MSAPASTSSTSTKRYLSEGDEPNERLSSTRSSRLSPKITCSMKTTWSARLTPWKPPTRSPRSCTVWRGLLPRFPRELRLLHHQGMSRKDRKERQATLRQLFAPCAGPGQIQTHHRLRSTVTRSAWCAGRRRWINYPRSPTTIWSGHWRSDTEAGDNYAFSKRSTKISSL